MRKYNPKANQLQECTQIKQHEMVMLEDMGTDAKLLPDHCDKSFLLMLV